MLDEPSIGLHPRDNQRLIDALRNLESQGNTVVVVEHDEAMMRAADTLIDVGPAAGRGGGRIVAQGTPAEVIADPDSITGRYLVGRNWRFRCPRRGGATTKTNSLDAGRGDDEQPAGCRSPDFRWAC